MKTARHFFLGITIIFFMSITALHAAQKSTSPVGRWQALFPGSGFPEFIMAITEDGYGVITGTIVEVFAKPGREPQVLCTRCTGSRQNQPLLGMVILENARYDSKAKAWVGGTYVAPDTGRTYGAMVWTSSGGQALRIQASTSSANNGLTHNYRWQRVS